MHVWRRFPLRLGRAIARAVARSPYLAPIRAMGRPLVAWLLFSVNLACWHVPAAYDLTLGNDFVHAREHITFLAFGILLWSQVIASPPVRARLPYLQRIGYVAGVMAVNMGVAMVLSFARAPLYAAYANEAHRPIRSRRSPTSRLPAGSCGRRACCRSKLRSLCSGNDGSQRPRTSGGAGG